MKVVQLVGSDHFHIGQQVGGVLVRAGDARFHLAPSYANFVDKLAVRGHEWMAGKAAQHIDGATFDVIGLQGFAKQRAGIGVGNAAAGVVLVQCAYQ
ncbi:hypothetical protein FQZ97_837360 [compost metagenome]